VEKPETFEECNIEECAEWNVTEWSSVSIFVSWNQNHWQLMKKFLFLKCSSICGVGFQTRNVFCSKSVEMCNRDKIPETRQSCFAKSCYQWVVDDWSNVTFSFNH
jgi:hypothetical protein